MAQLTKGLYRLTQLPSLYLVVQRILARKDAQRRLVTEVIKPRRSESVLDLGCGPGTLCPLLEVAYYKGVDLNADHIAVAKERYENFEFECSDANEFLNSTTQRFDLILMIGFLHHLDDAEVVTVLHRCKRVLNTGGRVITIDPGFETRQNPVARLLAGLDSGRNVRTRDGYMELVKLVFPEAQGYLRHDFLRVPYTHVVTQCS